jgi:hypothetical protein
MMTDYGNYQSMTPRKTWNRNEKTLNFFMFYAFLCGYSSRCSFPSNTGLAQTAEKIRRFRLITLILAAAVEPRFSAHGFGCQHFYFLVSIAVSAHATSSFFCSMMAGGTS